MSGMRSAPPRHQTLRAAVDWTYGLLEEPECQLFNRLSVFAGSFSVSAAEAVCANGADVLQPLATLVDRSLVVLERAADDAESRYRLLETLRAYAWERLNMGSEADQVQQRHALWTLELAEQAERAFHGSDESAWLWRLRKEHDNLRSALGWTTSTGDADRALRLVSGAGLVLQPSGRLDREPWMARTRTDDAGSKRTNRGTAQSSDLG